MPIRFLIVDDHPIVLQAMRGALSRDFRGAEVVEATTVEKALALLKVRSDYDLAVVDLALPGTKGLDGLIAIRSAYPRLPVLILSGLDDPRIVAGVIGAGAAGFVAKSASPEEIANAVKAVMRGDVVVPAGFETSAGTAGSSDVAQRVAQLTRQQLRVLQMIRQGKLNKQIAFELGVGETTVKAHVSEILRKLGVSSRTQIVIEVAALDFDRLLATGRGAAAD